MKIAADGRAILRFILSNVRGCNVGITDGKITNLAVLLTPDGMIYKPSFKRTCSRKQKLMDRDTEIHRHTEPQTAR
jgi:hypothetical protein